MNPDQPVGFTRIGAGDAARLLRDGTGITLFDVRDAGDYRAAHVEGAAHLTTDRLPAWVKRLPKEAPVLIYCYHGNASQAYAQMFADFRFTRVFSVDGGYSALAAAVAAA